MLEKAPISVFHRLAKTLGQLTGVPATPPLSATGLTTVTFSRKPPDPTLLARLARTETGQDLAVRAREAGILISVANPEHMKGEVSRSHFNHIVEINDALDEDAKLMALAGELARILLARNDLTPTRSHTSLARIQIARVVSGHTLATRAQIADELARIGDAGPRAIFASQHPDIMRAYDRSRHAHPDAGTNGAAMAAAFIASYENRERLATEELREIGYLEHLPGNILADVRNFNMPYSNPQRPKRRITSILRTLISHPRQAGSMPGQCPSLLPTGNADLLKLVNAKGIPYVATFFPHFMPADGPHGSVTPAAAERIRLLDAKRSPLARQFRKASAIPVHLAEQQSISPVSLAS